MGNLLGCDGALCLHDIERTCLVNESTAERKRAENRAERSRSVKKTDWDTYPFRRRLAAGMFDTKEEKICAPEHRHRLRRCSRYRFGGKIGEGAFATVFKCMETQSGKFRACKRIDKKKMRAILRCDRKAIEERVATEIKVASSVVHENICRIYESFSDSRYHYVIMELMEGGELFDYVIERGSLTEGEAVHIIRQVTRAIHRLHQSGIIHRDIKPENVMLKSKEPSTMDVRLIDFGMSKLLSPGQRCTRSRLGTPGYIAPEIVNGDPYTKSIDMWSLGVLTYILLCGYMPFDDTYGKSSSFKTDFPDAEWGKISLTAKRFVRGLIEKDPVKRMTSAEALKHRWLSTTFSRFEGHRKSAPTLLASPKNLHTKRMTPTKRPSREDPTFPVASLFFSSHFDTKSEATPYLGDSVGSSSF